MTDIDTEHQPGASDRTGTGSAAATFHATREELLGDRPLLGSAELARTYCAGADRVVSVVAITAGHLRRVDCWLGGVGFVSHAAATDPSTPLLGSVCDRYRAADLTGSIVESLVGGLRSTPATVALELTSIGAIGPDSLPDGVGSLVVVSAKRTTETGPPERIVVADAGGGLSVAPLRTLDESVRLEPVTPERLRQELVRLIGDAPRSVRELLD